MRGGAFMEMLVRVLVLGMVVVAIGVIHDARAQTPAPTPAPAPAAAPAPEGNIYSVTYVEVMPTAKADAVMLLRRYREAGIWAQSAEVSREGFARLSASLLSGGFISRIHAYEDCVDQSLY